MAPVFVSIELPIDLIALPGWQMHIFLYFRGAHLSIFACNTHTDHMFYMHHFHQLFQSDSFI
jgi:hypothetical protein